MTEREAIAELAWILRRLAWSNPATKEMLDRIIAEMVPDEPKARTPGEVTDGA